MLRQNGTRSYSRVHTIEQGLINETMKKRMNELEEQCTKIDVLSDEIEDLQKQTLELRDKKLCTNCFKEIDLCMINYFTLK